jgi:hypothetical protein
MYSLEERRPNCDQMHEQRMSIRLSILHIYEIGKML